VNTFTVPNKETGTLLKKVDGHIPSNVALPANAPLSR
jgi:hypothetical protein